MKSSATDKHFRNVPIHDDFVYLQSDLSAGEMYREIDLDQFPDKEGGLTGSLQPDQHWRQHLFFVDDFVNLAIRTEKPYIEILEKTNGSITHHMSPLARAYYHLIFLKFNPESSEYLFSENVELFLKCAEELCLPLPVRSNPVTLIKQFGVPYRYNFPEDSRCADVFNRLVDLIREGANHPAFKKRVRDRERGAAANYQTSMNYVAGLFSETARLLVLRVDLHYDKKKLNGHVSASKAREDLNRFFNNRRHNGLFASMKGYIWKLENTRLRGIHFHLLLFLDGGLAHQHAYLAEEFGKYWVNTITKGTGTYHNCHRDPSKYRRSGIGMIHTTDSEKIGTLNVILKYITKLDQYLRIKGGRSFGHGVLPVRGSSKKLGRPRVKNMNVNDPSDENESVTY